MGLFGKTQEKNPKDMVNEWSHKIRKEGYQLERQIRAIQREEDKVKRSLKEAAKKGDKGVCTILAKEVIRARKAISKINTSKAHLNSIQLQMKNQLATLRVAGSLQKSTEVMQAIQSLVRVPEVAATMRDLSKEMMRAGIIEEMMEETMDILEDQDELEEEAQEEVDKVLWELTAGQLGQAPAAVTDTLPASGVSEAAGASAVLEDAEELEDMQSRLQALRS
ncbi:Charged multivesicular body protein 3 [Cryptotermes secundus]|uniref:Charged multivesicular body protein 3 n=1 Tax=Cryptotermes secundus TaxID=105785 RepID=A0A2J7PYU5_9NEOP|nr:charged multivesicular body protein 3 [Cryptotermes secundus]XP_023719441.1 charged multivesicular body protein 3 [Cryptotermes secundus]XP_023719442.1 charged multivesicular body protein 3 [Cryptotermes secundus]PNF21511.1 Charged multivesicular body protein 3 [Cryptotermes secundus]PNF21512.1 Charged multivesicular body protein 3 [Cryptotermes secundus]